MRVLLYGMLAGLLLAGCTHHTPLPETHYIGVGWSASEQDGKFYIFALDSEAEARAVQELCPTREFYCLTAPPFAQVSVLERKKK